MEAFSAHGRPCSHPVHCQGLRYVPGPPSSSGRQSLLRAGHSICRGSEPRQLSHRPASAHQQRPVSRQAALQTALGAAASDGAQPKEGDLTHVAEDKWIARTLLAFQAATSSQPVPPPLEEMRIDCAAALRTQRMPTTRNEEYKFTDVTPILQLQPQVSSRVADLPADALAELAEAHSIKAAAAKVVVIDGVVAAQLSDTQRLPQQVYLGSVRDVPPEALGDSLGLQARTRGSPFALINGATATDALCLIVPEGVAIEGPIHILYIASGRRNITAQRLLCMLGADSSAEVIEEFVGPAEAESASHLSNAVAEFSLAERAQLKHGYVALEGAAALHMKGTLVSQATGSGYALTEARLGGRLTRHDLSIQQTGGETSTEMGSFLLCGEGQLHDLHSKLRLEHPGGTANQLHKCIVAAGTGRGVFDGNVRVERFAQKSDAGQLSRNLLLVPRATVNVKPNLQIVADDVKCTHGCAVSDLEEDQLFYFRARGVDSATARKVLVYSFGAEITMQFPHQELRDRIQSAVDAALASVPILDVQTEEAAKTSQ